MIPAGRDEILFRSVSVSSFSARPSKMKKLIDIFFTLCNRRVKSVPGGRGGQGGRVAGEPGSCNHHLTRSQNAVIVK